MYKRLFLYSLGFFVCGLIAELIVGYSIPASLRHRQAGTVDYIVLVVPFLTSIFFGILTLIESLKSKLSH